MTIAAIVEEARELDEQADAADIVAPLLPAQTQGAGIHGGYKGSSGSHGPKGLGIHHHAIIDVMLAEPGLSNGAIAARFNVTPGYLSCIIHSDAFQLELSKRRDEIKVGIVTKVSALADLATERLIERLPLLSHDELINVQKNSLRSLGYGGPKAVPAAAGGAQVNVNVLVAPETVRNARAKIDERRRAALEHNTEPGSHLAGPEDVLDVSVELGAALDGEQAGGPSAPTAESPPG